jgi:hypothetical protein
VPVLSVLEVSLVGCKRHEITVKNPGRNFVAGVGVLLIAEVDHRVTIRTPITEQRAVAGGANEHDPGL